MQFIVLIGAAHSRKCWFDYVKYKPILEQRSQRLGELMAIATLNHQLAVRKLGRLSNQQIQQYIRSLSHAGDRLINPIVYRLDGLIEIAPEIECV